jgi:hypothetical protein
MHQSFPKHYRGQSESKVALLSQGISFYPRPIIDVVSLVSVASGTVGPICPVVDRRSDYRDMAIMIFSEIPELDAIVDVLLQRLEDLKGPKATMDVGSNVVSFP